MQEETITLKLNDSDVKYGILVTPKQIDLRSINNKHIWIKDAMGKVKGNIHSSVNRIDGLTQWHRTRMTKIGDEITIKYDKNEIEDGLNVINIEFRTPIETNQENDEIGFSFAVESQLAEYLVENIGKLEQGLSVHKQEYSIEENRIDLLCIDKDRNYVVVEIKNRKTSDQVVGQILRYIGCVKELKNVKTVRGIIVTPEYDRNLEYAISNVPDVTVKYFKLAIEFTDGKNA